MGDDYIGHTRDKMIHEKSNAIAIDPIIIIRNNQYEIKHFWVSKFHDQNQIQVNQKYIKKILKNVTNQINPQYPRYIVIKHEFFPNYSYPLSKRTCIFKLTRIIRNQLKAIYELFSFCFSYKQENTK